MPEAEQLRLNTFKCSNFSLMYKKRYFWPQKMQITANVDIILENGPFCIFLGLKYFVVVQMCLESKYNFESIANIIWWI